MEVMLQELSVKLFLKLWRLSFVYGARLLKWLVEILFCGFLNFLHGPVRENPSTSLEERLRISNIAKFLSDLSYVRERRCGVAEFSLTCQRQKLKKTVERFGTVKLSLVPELSSTEGKTPL